MYFNDILMEGNKGDASFARSANGILNNDIGNVMTACAVNMINKLIESSDEGNKIDRYPIMDEVCHPDGITKDVTSNDVYISKVTEGCGKEYNAAMEKLRKISKGQMSTINAHPINPESKNKIKSYLLDKAGKIIAILNNLDEDEIRMLGYPVDGIENASKNNMMFYVKEALKELVTNLANDMADYILNQQCQQQVQIPVQAPTMPMVTPLVMNTGSSIPSYNDEDINKHFVITQNVNIYDPETQRQFGEMLKGFAKQLDDIDKSRGLTSPSKFIFEQFYSPYQFVAVRVDDSGNPYHPTDMQNYMCIYTDYQTGQIVFAPATVQAAATA